MSNNFSISILGRFVVVGAILAFPVLAQGQEATLSGTVMDTTGGVLPGVTIRAVHVASGNTFETVTDGGGGYRLPLRTGVFELTAQLQGFATLTRTGLELLVGQQAVVNLQMAPSALQETVTVTGEAPLLDVTSSSLGGNIDPRQMQELPLNGRNWVDLVILAPGHRGNSVVNAPIPRADRAGFFHLNVDGQQLTNLISSQERGQPRFSREAIAEFEFVSNRFDAVQGRSAGVQVNAVTKSGTNTFSGTLSGYFRDDTFSAADLVVGRVLPYSNQQVTATFGGPIRKDRIHFFSHYEYEREPATFVHTTPWPRFNLDFTSIRREDKLGGKLDVQFSPQTRLSVLGTAWRSTLPHEASQTGGSTRHPSVTRGVDYVTDQVFVTLVRVFGNRAVNEMKGGYTTFGWDNYPHTKNPGSLVSRELGGPSIRLRGLTIGQQSVAEIRQSVYQFRNDFSYHFTKGGRHALKLGGEYLTNELDLWQCSNCLGTLDARLGPPPANLEDLFPVWNDVSTWNLAPLSPLARSFSFNVGSMEIRHRRHGYAAWLQDDWAITRRLTLNLGVRYDLAIGAFGEKIEFQPFLKAGRPADTNNIAPRLGFAFTLTDRTVIRGGFGKYFGDMSHEAALWLIRYKQNLSPEVFNDGRPDFATKPFNGPMPTFEEVARLGLPRHITSELAAPDLIMPYSYQSSIGVQRQLSESMAVEADYVFTGGRHEHVDENINLSYNSATGVNYPFTDASKRPYPGFTVVSMWRPTGRSNYHALQTAFTKRFSRGWQASATYMLSGVWDEDPVSAPPGCEYPYIAPGVCNVPFTVAPDLGGQYTLATTDQRHRAVLNGIWEVGYGVQLSGLYFFGSGERRGTTYGADLRGTGKAEGRLRPDGTIVRRNNFVGEPIHRVDLRMQRQFRLVGRAGVDGILEVFNLFNHKNYGSYVTDEASALYGRPTQNLNVAYAPRTLQLGFRFTF